MSGSVPMPTWALKATEKLPQIAIFSATRADVTLSISRPPILFWNIDRHQAQITGLSEQAFHDVEVFCLDRGNLRLDLFFSEVHRCVLDLPLNIRDIFPGEDILRAGDLQ